MAVKVGWSIALALVRGERLNRGEDQDLNATPLSIADVVLLEPNVFEDERGYFYESYHRGRFADATGVRTDFVQDNHSLSHSGVLRGLHFQRPPKAQGKLVRVIHGAVFDVAVDMRPASPTFGRWVGERLSAGNRRQLWIPPGFAHGFLALEDGTELVYKATALYDKAAEGAIRWNDPTLAIEWPLQDVVLNARDASAPAWQEAVS
jgi:dTDP-4-dehydrorhamnose 3,5-epimerase